MDNLKESITKLQGFEIKYNGLLEMFSIYYNLSENEIILGMKKVCKKTIKITNCY